MFKIRREDRSKMPVTKELVEAESYLSNALLLKPAPPCPLVVPASLQILFGSSILPTCFSNDIYRRNTVSFNYTKINEGCNFDVQRFIESFVLSYH